MVQLGPWPLYFQSLTTFTANRALRANGAEVPRKAALGAVFPPSLTIN